MPCFYKDHFLLDNCIPSSISSVADYAISCEGLYRHFVALGSQTHVQEAIVFSSLCNKGKKFSNLVKFTSFFMPSQVYLISVQNIEIYSTLYMISIVQYYKLIDWKRHIRCIIYLKKIILTKSFFFMIFIVGCK